MMIDKEYEAEIAKAKTEYEDVKTRGKAAIGRKWEEIEKELFTPEEIQESHLKALLVRDIIKTKREKGVNQIKLEKQAV